MMITKRRLTLALGALLILGHGSMSLAMEAFRKAQEQRQKREGQRIQVTKKTREETTSSEEEKEEREKLEQEANVIFKTLQNFKKVASRLKTKQIEEFVTKVFEPKIKEIRTSPEFKRSIKPFEPQLNQYKKLLKAARDALRPALERLELEKIEEEDLEKRLGKIKRKRLEKIEQIASIFETIAGFKQQAQRVKPRNLAALKKQFDEHISKTVDSEDYQNFIAQNDALEDRWDTAIDEIRKILEAKELEAKKAKPVVTKKEQPKQVKQIFASITALKKLAETTAIKDLSKFQKEFNEFEKEIRASPEFIQSIKPFEDRLKTFKNLLTEARNAFRLRQQTQSLEDARKLVKQLKTWEKNPEDTTQQQVKKTSKDIKDLLTQITEQTLQAEKKKLKLKRHKLKKKLLEELKRLAVPPPLKKRRKIPVTRQAKREKAVKMKTAIQKITDLTLKKGLDFDKIAATLANLKNLMDAVSALGPSDNDRALAEIPFTKMNKAIVNKLDLLIRNKLLGQMRGAKTSAEMEKQFKQGFDVIKLETTYQLGNFLKNQWEKKLTLMQTIEQVKHSTLTDQALKDQIKSVEKKIGLFTFTSEEEKNAYLRRLKKVRQWNKKNR